MKQDHARAFLKATQTKIFSPAFKITTSLLLVVFLFFVAGSYIWAQSYEGRLAPSVKIGGIAVGGLDVETARGLIQNVVDTYFQEGIQVTLGESQGVLPFATLVGEDLIEQAHFNVDDALTQALAISKRDQFWKETILLLRSLFKTEQIPVKVTVNEQNLTEDLRELFPNVEQGFLNTSYVFWFEEQGWQAEVKQGETGTVIDFPRFFSDLIEHFSQLGQFSLEVYLLDQEPEVSVEEAEVVKEKALSLLQRAPYTLTAFEEDAEVFVQSVTGSDLALLLIPTSKQTISLNADAFHTFLKTAASAIETSAVNAQFSIEGGRVTAFIPSKSGTQIDEEATREKFIEVLQSDEETKSEIILFQTFPDVTTEEVNDLGITEKLGVGTSSYRWSPYNRIRNITNGVRLLNGLLIAPGDTFSLLAALAPFNYENGYYEELVIKGDKIEPEVGGGLCQIGTTTFRAVMNSGLLVVKRSNHSLVVSYYNDPSNGNPGTDATIYDPAPDFQFINDTGSYLLFQAEMFEEKQELAFTFWGTSDGREGSYSPPVVTEWIPVGEPQQIETLDLELGEEECQSAHIGANASFTYSVLFSDGTTQETVYESHYRPLPQICLIGVEELSQVEEILPEEETVLLDEEVVVE
ncbi:MAG: VanW family protein [Candidatus Uhrbacteria bacterium GW2011_GWE2_40_58]|nr:MAG: VanW family protein [Candidatus Uhrbacteria bacterium GW2011_GWF2_40_263]KKR67924.1 MAG: VanW family protein [Candidatus Uhrbacteria bacterium GW2011_GWE2_40_58]OGL93934.1 MAG: hypothetical protein A2239_02465 [Candidatus Uhrbacteria bacterium RIFOXYA2_FULL_40_9]OGL96893.1 MAG: hypothetical protein A2332_02135 [Candidatus Uhrbacteria bacterium RIFOXYB2_FULL_41_18]HBK34512.1 hypothetical protein [Candidatus Uhrbacteria bacterium]